MTSTVIHPDTEQAIRAFAECAQPIHGLGVPLVKQLLAEIDHLRERLEGEETPLDDGVRLPDGQIVVPIGRWHETVAGNLWRIDERPFVGARKWVRHGDGLMTVPADMCGTETLEELDQRHPYPLGGAK